MDQPTPVREPVSVASRAERVLVLAPTGGDTAVITQILGRSQLEAITPAGLPELAAEWQEGVDSIVIASEALSDREWSVALRQLFDGQDTWSEIPVILLGGGTEGEAAEVVGLLGDHMQLLILERPLGIATFVSAVEGALRSRRRQHEVKRLLDELALSAVAIAETHRDADRAKDEFLATLAHELRSPMTAIRGWIQMLRMADLDPPAVDQALAMIESSTRVQAHIIEDLMDVSRILAGKVMIAPATIDLVPVIENVIATFRPAAVEHGIEITAALPPRPLNVFADATRLQQVGWNLLSNAIKFTPEGGTVQVAVQQEGDRVLLRVRDNGRGISPELLPHVFDRYRQDESSGGMAHHGLGLGLAIVRHLVESHDGTIVALSEGLGTGAEFVMSLPLCGPAPSEVSEARVAS